MAPSREEMAALDIRVSHFLIPARCGGNDLPNTIIEKGVVLGGLAG